MTQNDLTDPNGPYGVSRRVVLTVGAVGASSMALAACSKAKSADSAAPPATTAATSAAGAASSAASSADSSGGGGGAALAKLSDIKVGEAISAKGADGSKILISRPTETTVAAFSAICTHMGCTVAPAGKELDCPCHGSRYNAVTGAVLGGPAPRGLSAVAVKISGDNVVAG